LTRYTVPEPCCIPATWSLGDEKDVPNILEQKKFSSWNVFHSYTKNYFQPFEQCDCVRVAAPTAFEIATLQIQCWIMYLFFQKYGGIVSSASKSAATLTQYVLLASFTRF
jgi:hypothetical protein